jgi:hypothetical protein
MWGKAFAAAVVASSPACGGSSASGGTCSAAAACGGDIVGSWKVVSACAQGTSSENEQGGCAVGISIELSDASGSETFNADGTYMSDLSLSATLTFTIGAACLSANGVTATCAQEASAFTANMTAPSSGTTISSPFTCAPAAGGGCSCTISETASNQMASGTYMAVGTTVSQTETGGTASPSGYCVQGSELNLIESTQGLSMGSMGNGVAKLVLTRE